MTPIATFLGEPATNRGLLWLALNAKGKVLTREDKSDGAGGSEETYKAGEEIPCRIDPLGKRGHEGEAADRVSDLSDYIVTLQPGTAITLKDDFEVIGVGRFEVVAIRSRTGEKALQIEVAIA